MRVIRSDDSETILSPIRAGVNVDLSGAPGCNGTVEAGMVGWGRGGRATRKRQARKAVNLWRCQSLAKDQCVELSSAPVKPGDRCGARPATTGALILSDC